MGNRHVATRYLFKAELWKHSGKGGWYFVTLPKKNAALIRKRFGNNEEGWGRLAVTAVLKKVKWKTAIWWDSNAGSYLLPIKAVVRHSAKLKEGDQLSVVVIVGR